MRLCVRVCVSIVHRHVGSVECRARIRCAGPGHLRADGGGGSGGHSGGLLVQREPVEGERAA